jgi:DNA-binding PadR family transcriptional regulator
VAQSAELPDKQPLIGYELRVVREVLLALLAGEPSHGYHLRARLALALGPLAGALNEGQVYVTLSRLEKAVSSDRDGSGRPTAPIARCTS